MRRHCMTYISSQTKDLAEYLSIFHAGPLLLCAQGAALCRTVSFRRESLMFLFSFSTTVSRQISKIAVGECEYTRPCISMWGVHDIAASSFLPQTEVFKTQVNCWSSRLIVSPQLITTTIDMFFLCSRLFPKVPRTDVTCENPADECPLRGQSITFVFNELVGWQAFQK